VSFGEIDQWKPNLFRGVDEFVSVISIFFALFYMSSPKEICVIWTYLCSVRIGTGKTRLPLCVKMKTLRLVSWNRMAYWEWRTPLWSLCTTTEYTIYSLVHKYVLRTSQNTQCVSIRKTNRWALCKAVIAVCCKSRMININALCEQRF
jgi:hypothetical protein